MSGTKTKLCFTKSSKVFNNFKASQNFHMWFVLKLFYNLLKMSFSRHKQWSRIKVKSWYLILKKSFTIKNFFDNTFSPFTFFFFFQKWFKTSKWNKFRTVYRKFFIDWHQVCLYTRCYFFQPERGKNEKFSILCYPSRRAMKWSSLTTNKE